MIRLLSLLLLALALLGCADDAPPEAPGKPQVLTTTNILGDVVRELAGDDATVTSLMGPGVDPHLYKATQGDLRRLTEADLIIYNGLHLEGKMGEVLEKMKRTRTVVSAAGGLRPDSLLLVADSRGGTVYDPHVWFDVRLWRQVVSYLGAQLQAFDTAHAAAYADRTARYLATLDALDAAVDSTLATVPPRQRVLITAHDAFGYFGRRYGVEVRGLQGISTVSEYGIQDVSELVSFIVERNIKAVFVESSVSARSIEAVVEGAQARGHTVRIGGTLYSDALGAAGTPEGTYVGTVRHNARTIAEALR